MNNPVFSRLMRAGPAGISRYLLKGPIRAYHRWRTRHAHDYSSPTQDQLRHIESRLRELGEHFQDLHIVPEQFERFAQNAGFAEDYHGGVGGGVYEEKLLEHFVAWHMLDLDTPAATPYVDIAACNSPWARLLREKGIEAYAIDLSLPAEFSSLGYYRQEDATATTFADASIGTASLQCAYEMFMGSSDILLLTELERILRPGGRVVISPLYLHTHPCYYQTQEYFGVPAGDAGAKAYARRDTWGVPASRKYSPETLQSRVLENARKCGLVPSLHVLRNAGDIADGIYLHFILVLDKPPHRGTLGGSKDQS